MFRPGTRIRGALAQLRSTDVPSATAAKALRGLGPEELSWLAVEFLKGCEFDDALRMLLRGGGMPDDAERERRAALLADHLRLLTEAGLDPNRFSDGDNPLWLCLYVTTAEALHVRFLRVLLEAGGDPDLPGTAGGTLLEYTRWCAENLEEEAERYVPLCDALTAAARERNAFG